MVSEAAFLFSPVFYPVLEFYQNGAHHPGGPAGDSGAGGMGLCGLQISFPQAFVYPVYCFNADAISGDHAVLISGAGPAASYGYAGWRRYFPQFFKKALFRNRRPAVILPAIFSTFPVFLIYRGFCSIHPGLLEAGRIDGAGELGLFVRIGLPLGSSGILSAFVLGFLEYWNMIEQPLTFLKSKELWPLSLYLPEIGLTQAGFAFAASVVTLIPAVFVFLLGQDYLEQGIAMSGLKE